MRPPQNHARPVVPGWPDAAIAEIAGGQATIVSSGQLRALGVSSSAIDRALRRGRLHRALALRPVALAATLDRALTRTSPSKLREAIARHPGRPGTARVAELLDPARPSADTWSRAEGRLLALIRRAELPTPEANVSLGRYTPDLLWREPRVIVEYDSDEVHSGPAAVRWDTGRHNALSAMGYTVLHVTCDELRAHQPRLLVQIAAALARAQP